MGAPNWYDVLDVDSSATTDEIRAAWRDAIADLTPADRRFRLYNQAAEVLLDPEQRAAHDAELAEGAEQEEPTPAPIAAPASDGGKPLSDEPAPEVDAKKSRDLPFIPAWLLVCLAALTALAVAVTAYLFVQPSEAEIEEAAGSARAAAERAIVPVLSYDYRELEASREAAHEFLTSSYRDDYDQLFEGVVTTNAESQQAVVTAEFVASSVVRAGEDRVELLLFVDQATTNSENDKPVVYKNQVRVIMAQEGDEWLVDCLITQPNGKCGS